MDEEIDQIWAEAFYYWSEGESIVLEGAIAEEAMRVQMSHTEGGELMGLIEEYLSMRLPADWEGYELHERREYIREYDETEASGFRLRERVCPLEIWCELLEGDRKNLLNAKAREITDVLQAIPGWVPYTNGTGKIRFGKLYGPQRAFIREATVH